VSTGVNRFSSDGVDIAFADTGEGPPILLIHGFGSNHAVNWESTGWTFTLTEAGRRVIAMDVRGHGESAKLYREEDYRPSLMAGDAANLLAHLGIAHADVMGYSMGGRIAAMLAIRHPSLVESLVIGGMGLGMVEGIGGEEEIVAALAAPSLDDAVGDRGRAYRKFAEQTRSDRGALAACIVGQRETILAAELGKIRAPTLIAVGEKDSVAGSAEGLAELIPGADVFIVPKRDHMRATGDKAFKARVLEFLEGNELRATAGR
jgi:pimeloyl-ACP methyl ester carboxylesterase